VIRSFADAGTERLFVTGMPRRLPPEQKMRKKEISAIHPGEFLAEILDESRLSQAQVARMIGVSPMRVSHVIKGTRPVTAELALLLGRAFGQSPQYWLNLQSVYDLRKAQSKLGARLEHVETLVAEPSLNR